MTEIVQGTLRGMGWEADCALLASSYEEPSPARPFYSHCAVVEAPEELPDGYYEVTFSGHSAFLHRANGTWSIGVPWHELPRVSSELKRAA